jgi:hypothetical protein
MKEEDCENNNQMFDYSSSTECGCLFSSCSIISSGSTLSCSDSRCFFYFLCSPTITLKLTLQRKLVFHATSGQIGEEPRPVPEEQEQTRDLTNERMRTARKMSRV